DQGGPGGGEPPETTEAGQQGQQSPAAVAARNAKRRPPPPSPEQQAQRQRAQRQQAREQQARQQAQQQLAGLPTETLLKIARDSAKLVEEAGAKLVEERRRLQGNDTTQPMYLEGGGGDLTRTPVSMVPPELQEERRQQLVQAMTGHLPPPPKARQTV